jgi:hypothetical protein
MQLIRFPSIEQLRNVVKTVRDRANYHKIPLPVLRFNGSVKLHGTNAGVVKDVLTGEIWAQSREQIITPEKDNAGFAAFVGIRKYHFDKLFNIAASVYGHQNLKPGEMLAIYGEWCGQGIQKGVAISGLPKMFVIFGIRVIPPRSDDDVVQDRSYWFTPAQQLTVADEYDRETINGDEDSIYFIQRFKTWSVEIDFSRPDTITNELVALTDTVEKECPVGASFGSSGIGEGIVWKCVSDWINPTSIDRGDDGDGSLHYIMTSDLIFKVKGEKHSDTKVKKTATVDVELMNSIHEFANAVTTDHRLEKMLDLLKQEGKEAVPENMGAFLKLVANDILKEESDTLEASGLEWKKAAGVVNTIARQWFLSPERGL